MRRPRPQQVPLGRSFRLLWAGQSVSVFGDRVFMVALAWQVAAVWHRPALLGLLLGTRVVAELLALLAAGWIVDRFPRRSIVLASDAGRAVLLVLLAVTIGGGADDTDLLFTLVAAFGLLTGPFRPALLAFMPELVSPALLPRANAWFALSTQVSLVAGPALGSVLVAIRGTHTALMLDGFSFAVACLCTALVPSRGARPVVQRLGEEALEGWRTVRNVPWLGGTVVLFSLANVGVFAALMVALPVAAGRWFTGVGGYGAILVAIGVGATVAALAIGHGRRLREPGRTAYGGVLLLALGIVGLGLTRSLLAAVALGLVIGFGQQVFELLWTVGLQRNVPDRLLGRVSAVDQFGSFAMLPVAFLLGGYAVSRSSPEVLLVAGGGGGVVLALIGLALPPLHRWRAVPEVAGPAGMPGRANGRDGDGVDAVRLHRGDADAPAPWQ